MTKFDALSHPVRCAGLAVAVFGIVVFGVSIFGADRALAQAASSKSRKSIYAVLAEAPEKAREKKNPFAGDSEAVAAGGKLFEQHCAECHGKKAGGTMHGANLLREEVQQATPGTLFWILTNGVVRRGMPVWSKLPEPERWQIVTFLESLQPHAVKTGAADPGDH
jgi:mono/diheme cytochrome c family protein